MKSVALLRSVKNTYSSDWLLLYKQNIQKWLNLSCYLTSLILVTSAQVEILIQRDQRMFEVCGQITCCRNDRETHQFLSREDFQQGQQHHTILDVLKQVCHHQRRDTLHEKQTHPWAFTVKMSFQTICYRSTHRNDVILGGMVKCLALTLKDEWEL